MRKIVAAALFIACCLPVTGEAEISFVPFGPPAPAWIRNAAPFVPEPGRALIAVVIDDMGVSARHSAEALKLPGAVTMSYLPYAADIGRQVAAAKAAGHEIVVHMPMEPVRKTANPGPDFLGTALTPEEVEARVVRNLAAFDGYVGVNNHMGSKFTQDIERVGILMRALKKRELMFLDSKTINSSVAEKVALENGIPATHRDIFLDDEERETFTENSLEKAEAYARKHGSAIAIGHPKEITLRDLNAWIPTLEAKGFQLAPLTAVMQYRIARKEQRRTRLSAAKETEQKSKISPETRTIKY